jgi:hypothetical protein
VTPRRPRSRSSNALLALALLAPAAARAQACCAGSSVLTPARLGIHEDAAVGAVLRGTGMLGSYDASGRFRPSPNGTAELGGELDAVGTVRLFSSLQLTLLVPVVATWRQVTGLAEFGGSLGDLNLSGRYDFTNAGRSTVVPGLAALAGVTFPTGRAPEDVSRPLATDATGIGAFQVTGGLAVEQSFGPVVVNLTGLVAWRTPRTVRGVSETLGVQFQGLLGAGYVFDSEASLGLSLNLVGELGAVIDGQQAPGSERLLPTVGLSGSVPLADAWRLQGGLTYNPPWPGRNQPAGLGFSLSLVRTWS